ncbi:hypothetical protein B0A50_05487 [Salinomyces thailandicus]|uniref:Uncharacterized protein n=1 Tax=Salinomyces thailandicus TaxID=706561 RepID=A0A4U0TVU4_9PEZI|nr:hypothetical protein B0A50_05487 [Salinomyces thailandica]
MPRPEHCDAATASYLRQVLRLNAGRTEEEADEELKQEAMVWGLDVEDLAAQQESERRAQQQQQLAARALSSDPPRRSLESVASRLSQSTLTSTFSDVSNSRGRSRASLSLRDYDAFALRSTINAATESKKSAAPSCCGRPIPGKLVEHVMTQAEQNALLEKLEQWDEASSVAESITSDWGTSMASQRPCALSRDSRTVSRDSKFDTVAPKVQQELDKVMERPDFKQLRQEQAEQRDRFLTWIENQRAELDTHHDRLRLDLQARHEIGLEELHDVHSTAMSDAEDKQVRAEGDMRETHAKERRDNATALKYMEAYCAGIYSTGEPHSRNVTEQDRAELDKVRRARDHMETKHDSAINVLRGEQRRRLRYRAQRQEREVQELRHVYRREQAVLERTHAEESQRLDDLVGEKRCSLRARWQIQASIIVKKFERETGSKLQAKLPAVEWQEGTVERAAAKAGAASEVVQYERRGSGKHRMSATSWIVRGHAQRSW